MLSLRSSPNIPAMGPREDLPLEFSETVTGGYMRRYSFQKAWTQVIKDFIGHKQQFELGPETDWPPINL